MESFREWLEGGVFRYDPSIQNQQLLSNIALIRRDPRFANYGDDQIEMMLHHHSPQEVLQHGPEEALNRYNNMWMWDLGDTDGVV